MHDVNSSPNRFTMRALVRIGQGVQGMCPQLQQVVIGHIVVQTLRSGETYCFSPKSIFEFVSRLIQNQGGHRIGVEASNLVPIRNPSDFGSVSEKSILFQRIQKFQTEVRRKFNCINNALIIQNFINLFINLYII